MIDVKQAIANAKAYATEILGEDELRLEEVHSDDADFTITLSFPERGHPRMKVNPLLSRTGGPREYKAFRVKKSSGEVVEMSIRRIA
jgi:hypothetical protein